MIRFYYEEVFQNDKTFIKFYHFGKTLVQKVKSSHLDTTSINIIICLSKVVSCLQFWTIYEEVVLIWKDFSIRKIYAEIILIWKDFSTRKLKNYKNEIFLI